MILLGMTEDELPNLEAFMKIYGMTVLPGYAADTARCYQNNPLAVFPEMTGSDYTEGISDDTLALILNSKAMTLGEPEKDTITNESMMSTSDSGLLLTEESQEEGTYVLGAVAEDVIDDDTTAKLIVLGTSTLIDDTITKSFTNLSNLTFFMNAVTSYFDDVSNISIEAKSLEVASNTIPAAGTYAVLFIGIIPVAVLVCGFVLWLKRRKA